MTVKNTYKYPIQFGDVHLEIGGIGTLKPPFSENHKYVEKCIANGWLTLVDADNEDETGDALKPVESMNLEELREELVGANVTFSNKAKEPRLREMVLELREKGDCANNPDDDADNEDETGDALKPVE
ncbi:MAG: hypothetical protein FWC70_07650 [Defluviitaleaceae bacterium]|nr:hypothetical protein [Defluviitaleaceae bacterium]